MTPRGIRTLLIVCGLGLLIWAALIAMALVVYLTTDQPIALP